MKNSHRLPSDARAGIGFAVVQCDADGDEDRAHSLHLRVGGWD